jgi:hypothetical protein
MSSDYSSPLEPLIAETGSNDRFVTRARPAFLYVIYAMILAALPIGALAGFSPSLADAIARGAGAYLAALPEPLYTLFGAGYLGYTAARQWGKVTGADR